MKALTSAVCVAVVLLLSTPIVHVLATELHGTTGGSLNALGSGYAIARWPWDSGDVLPGEDATVRAATTDPPHPEATHVVFRWIRPNGSHFDSAVKPLTLSGDTWDGKPVWDAYDTQTIDMIGSWGVQALFMDETGALKGPTDPYEVIQIRAISYHAIPEVPVGVAATLGMLGAVGVFVIFKRRNAAPSLPHL